MDIDLRNINDQPHQQPIRVHKKGVYLYTCKGYKLSSEIEGYNKTPFVKLLGEDANTKNIIDIVLWLPNVGDSKEKTETKLKIVKRAMSDLGAAVGSLTGRELLQDCVNKTMKVALKERERFGINKQGKPQIFNDAVYWYSGKADKPLTFNESKAYIPLSPQEASRFDKAIMEWENQQGYDISE